MTPAVQAAARGRRSGAAADRTLGLLAPLAMDVRSLAAFRIGTAAVLLADLAVRARDLGAHYTDAGMVARADTLTDFAFLHEWGVSVHLATGSWLGIASLFALQGVAAGALLIGHRTRLATVLSWGLLASLQLRNGLIGLSYDAILRLALFWACFLPLGATWSLDQARGRTAAAPARRVLGVASVALLVQIAIVYLGPGLAKAASAPWRDGTAVARVLNDEINVSRIGTWLATAPGACRLLTHAVWIGELVAVPLLFVPVAFGPLRCAVVAGLWLMHLGFGLGLRIGLFPVVDAVVLLALLPSWLWDRAGASADVAAWRDGRRWPPAVARLWAVSAPPFRPRPGRRRAGAALAGLLLALLVVWTAGVVRDPTYTAPRPWQWLWNGLFLEQDFRMFAHPATLTGWVTIPGTLRDGSTVELLAARGRVPDDGAVARVRPWTTRPPLVAATFANQRWRQLFKNIVYGKRGDRAPLLYGRHVCRTWNARHAGGRQLESFEVVFMRRPVRPEPPYRVPPAEYERHVTWRHWCFR